jgi:hypothetical protein
MAKLWIGNEGEQADPVAEAATIEAEILEPSALPVMPVRMRTRYTDQPVRPSSNFVAQLMAVDRDYPQTRETFRDQPDRANTAYRTAGGGYRSAAPTGARTWRTS